jgi:putative transposase
LARKHGTSEATHYNWKAKYGGMDVSDAKRLKALEDENAKLKNLLAGQMLEAAALKEPLSRNGKAHRQARSCRSSAGHHVPVRATGLLNHLRRSQDGPLSVQSIARDGVARQTSRACQRAAAFRLPTAVHPAQTQRRTVWD